MTTASDPTDPIPSREADERLIERLEDIINARDEAGHGYPQRVRDTCADARLALFEARAANARLRSEYLNAAKDCADLAGKLNAAEAALQALQKSAGFETDTWRARAQKAEADIDFAHSSLSLAGRRIEELEDALRPFAEAADIVRSYDTTITPKYRAEIESDNGMCAAIFSNGQVRRARSLLLDHTPGREDSGRSSVSVRAGADAPKASQCATKEGDRG